jgi:N-methylhydantoinase B
MPQLLVDINRPRNRLIADGRIDYDFAGTSPQVGKGINSCCNFTYGYAAYATKAALEPLIPNNEGCYRPIRMVAPEASLVNSLRPAPITVPAGARRK